MKIYFIRHGETVANAEKRFAGFSDVDLTDKGKLQAEQVGIKLKSTQLDAIYCSDLKRAKETALAISKHHSLSPIVRESFREMNFGLWEGKTFKEIKTTSKEAFDQWVESYEHYRVPEGENVKEMYERSSEQFEMVLKEYDLESDCHVAIVAHGGVIQSLLSHLCYGDISGYWRFSIENCGINIVEYVMGYPVIKKING